VKWLDKALGKSGRAEAEKWVTKGYVAQRKGQHDDAERAYIAAIRADPSLAVAHLDAGLAKLERFNRNRAQLDDTAHQQLLRDIETHLNDALTLNSSSVAGWRSMAHVCERQGNDVGAMRAWDHVLRLLGDDAAHEEARNAAHSARKRLQRSAERQLLLEQVHAALGKDASLDARQAAHAALQAAWRASTTTSQALPWPPRIEFWAARLARRAQALDVALVHLDAWLAQHPSDAEALHELATLHQERGDARAALDAALRAYRADPLQAAFVCNVGVCYLQLGDVDKADEYIRIARGMAEQDPIIARAAQSVAELRKARG
jgi:tetratricopeptide (TPR) repeat protein